MEKKTVTVSSIFQNKNKESLSMKTTRNNATDQITLLSTLTLYIAAVGTAWSLLGSPRNGQAELYLFLQHLLCWKHFHSFGHC
jgi:hypothetical protein